MSLGDLKEKIKDAPVSSIVGYYIPLKRSGLNLLGLCPFHSDSKPSLTVSDQKGLYKCFACDAGGDAITFVEKYKNFSFIEALEECSKILGIPFEEYKKEEKKSPKTMMAEKILFRASQLYKKTSLKLWDLDKLGYDIFVKPRVNKKIIIDSILTPISLTELTGAMLDFLRRDKRKYAVVKRDRLSIKEKLQFMKHFLKMNQKYELTELIKMDGDMSIDNIVITFISVLELARMRRLAIFQNENYASIYIEVVKSLEDFDVNLANGFEPEDGTGGDLLDANEENTELEPGAQPVLLH